MITEGNSSMNLLKQWLFNIYRIISYCYSSIIYQIGANKHGVWKLWTIKQLSSEFDCLKLGKNERKSTTTSSVI